MKVLRISANDTRNIRQQVLRPESPIDECVFDGDDDDQTFHLCVFIDSRLVSIASFYFEKHLQLEAPYQYRLRGMATLPDYRGQGHSSALLKTGFPIVIQNLCSLVWCNARENALGFYEKLGFQSDGDFFDIEDIGPHKLMIRKLEEK